MPHSISSSSPSQAYTALYRRWRPRLFSEVVGQKHVTRTLQNALSSGRVAHAYLFCGLRGTGKTTMAKLLARALNCREGVGPEPCNACPTCLEILEGRSVDVLEIDAASNRGIDEIRDLRDKALYTTAQSRYKVYIVDEVHMLTNEAFNALLKILEEPPPKVIFILATTEVYKLPLTVVSRCQRFDFHLLGSGEIAAHLGKIAAALDFELDGATLYLLAQQAEGSMRDALGFLEQCRAYGGEKLSYGEAREILGLAAPETVFNLLEAIVQDDTGSGLAALSALVYEGRDLHRFIRELILYLRKLVVLQSGEDEEKILAENPGLKPYLSQHRGKFDNAVLLEMLEILQELTFQLRSSSQPQFLLELTFLRLQRAHRFRRYFSPGSLFEYLEELEEKLQASAQTLTPDFGSGDTEHLVARQRRVPAPALEDKSGGKRKTVDVFQPAAMPGAPETTGRVETAEQAPAETAGADAVKATGPPKSPPEMPPAAKTVSGPAPAFVPPATDSSSKSVPGTVPVPGPEDAPLPPNPVPASGSAPPGAGPRAPEGPELQEFWDGELLPELKKQRRHVLHALLLEAAPLSCKKGVLMFGFPPTHSIHKERVESSRHKKNLEALLSTLLGTDTVFRIILQENDPEKKNKEAATGVAAGTGEKTTAGAASPAGSKDAAADAAGPGAAFAGDDSNAGVISTAADAVANDIDAVAGATANVVDTAVPGADAAAAAAGAGDPAAIPDATAAGTGIPGTPDVAAAAKRAFAATPQDASRKKQEGDYFMQEMADLFKGKPITAVTEKFESRDFWRFDSSVPAEPEK